MDANETMYNLWGTTLIKPYASLSEYVLLSYLPSSIFSCVTVADKKNCIL